MISHCHTAALAHLDLVGFVVLGALGSFGHCSLMCSPFVLFVSRRYCAAGCPRRATLRVQLWYHAGRLTTYAALGAAAGAVGSAIEVSGRLVGFQRAAAVLAGAALVLFVASTITRLVPSTLDGSAVFSRALQVIGRRMPGHPLATGLVLGLLPCGLLYSALIAAAALGDAVHGAAALFCFGAATMPTLLGLSVLDNLLAPHRVIVNRVSNAFILTMGLRFLYVGLVR